MSDSYWLFYVRSTFFEEYLHIWFISPKEMYLCLTWVVLFITYHQLSNHPKVQLSVRDACTQNYYILAIYFILPNYIFKLKKKCKTINSPHLSISNLPISEIITKLTVIKCKSKLSWAKRYKFLNHLSNKTIPT